MKERPKDARSSLLDSIHKGVALRKTEVRSIRFIEVLFCLPSSTPLQVDKKSEPAAAATVGGAGFNVAMILSRRAAIEFSDDEDDDDDDEWEDDD